jgi:hypothetical protein
MAIGRRHQACIDSPGNVLPDPPQLSFLDHAQDLRLCPRRELADLVEEQRAAMRLFEDTGAIGDGARERAARMPEQF